MGNFWNGVNPQAVSNAPDSFAEFKVGDNVAEIVGVEEGVSQSGNPMLIITFENDEGARIRHYITEGEYKLSNLKQLYAAFDIPMGTVNTNMWMRKHGIVVCKKGEPYNGKTYNKVSYLRPLDAAQGQKPPRPVAPPAAETNPPSDDGFADDIPF